MLDHSGFSNCPKCGGRSLAVHMKNGMICGSCGYIYFHNMAAAVAGIIEVDDRIILMRRAHDPRKGLLDLPGGFVDYNESFETALAREIKEELNLDVTHIRYFGSLPNTYIYKEVTYFTADAFFLCRPVNVGRLALSEENTEHVLVRPGELDPASIAFPHMAVMLERYRLRGGALR